MRFLMMSLLSLSLMSGVVEAQLKAEQIGVSDFPVPVDSWFVIKSLEGSYIFDGDSGEMQGMISHNWVTPAIASGPARKEAYLVESWYSRGVRGTREDVLTIIDMNDLSVKAEIDIPDKASALSFRNHIGLLGDQRHVTVFNMTPAQSVSVVDVIDREFAGEISTPGCAIIMPTGETAFMMICGDGTLQYIGIGEDGKETVRERSKSFFSVDSDPVFDKPMKTGEGWLLISHSGRAFEVRVDKGRMKISEPWSLLSDEDKEENWRPGGPQPFTVHRNSNLLYVLMHQGGVDTHHDNGTEVWIYSLANRKRVGKFEFEEEVSHILSSQEDHPKLYVFNKEHKLLIYDGRLFRLLRTIEEPGPGPGLLQTLAHHD
jgi:methylamine dehydrogenase heavy chain